MFGGYKCRILCEKTHRQLIRVFWELLSINDRTNNKLMHAIVVLYKTQPSAPSTDEQSWLTSFSPLFLCSLTILNLFLSCFQFTNPQMRPKSLAIQVSSKEGGLNICRARYPHAARGISCEELWGCLIHKRCHPCKPPDFIMTNSWWFN